MYVCMYCPEQLKDPNILEMFLCGNRLKLVSLIPGLLSVIFSVIMRASVDKGIVYLYEIETV